MLRISFKIERSPAHCSRRDALSAAYPAENDDLLSYEWVESTQGPPRKYYSLTPQGETFLSGLEAAWEELANTVNHLKTIKTGYNEKTLTINLGGTVYYIDEDAYHCWITI